MAVTTILRIGDRERISSGKFTLKAGERPSLTIVDGQERLTYFFKVMLKTPALAKEFEFNPLDGQTAEITYYIEQDYKRTNKISATVGEFNNKSLLLEVNVIMLEWWEFDINFSFWLKDLANG